MRMRPRARSTSSSCKARIWPGRAAWTAARTTNTLACSVRQYQRANGEVIALLVVAPSKTDRERVIPMSAELFHVIAIIRRHTRDGRTIPLLRRFDPHDKV